MTSAQGTNNYHQANVTDMTRKLLVEVSNGTKCAQLAIEAELQMLLGNVGN